MPRKILPAAQRGVGIRVAHDPGDPLITSHCPFCGSGQVVGRSDGTIECGFCGQNYIVRVQPAFPGMPQAPGEPGAPTDIGPDGGLVDPGMVGPDGMPMDDEGGFPPDEDDEGAAPPFGGNDDGGDEGDEEGFPPEEDDQEDEAPPEKDKGSKKPPPKKAKASRRREAAIYREPLPDTPYWRRMQQGHKMRTGHDLDAHLETGEDGISQVHRHCCGFTPADQDWLSDRGIKASRRYRGLDGRTAMTEDQYVRHLAANLSGHHPAVLAALRAEANGPHEVDDDDIHEHMTSQHGSRPDVASGLSAAVLQHVHRGQHRQYGRDPHDRGDDWMSDIGTGTYTAPPDGRRVDPVFGSRRPFEARSGPPRSLMRHVRVYHDADVSDPYLDYVLYHDQEHAYGSGGRIPHEHAYPEGHANGSILEDWEGRGGDAAHGRPHDGPIDPVFGRHKRAAR